MHWGGGGCLFEILSCQRVGIPSFPLWKAWWGGLFDYSAKPGPDFVKVKDRFGQVRPGAWQNYIIVTEPVWTFLLQFYSHEYQSEEIVDC